MGVDAKDNTFQGEFSFEAEMANELTPISVKEAESVIGKSSQYKTSEAVANAILDFTAIARAYFRNIPKYPLQEYNKA